MKDVADGCLVELDPDAHEFELCLAYATAENLAGRPLYGVQRCLLAPRAAEALLRANALARAQGWTLRIFDAYRPAVVQRHFWSILPDAKYVADPARGSNHTRGVALDLTLVDEDGEAFEMGTAFDEFGPLSHSGSTAIAPQAQRNRFLLTGLMVAAGFVSHPFEWWHFNLPDPRSHPLVEDGSLVADWLREVAPPAEVSA